eukprot:Opistho-2@81331
MSVVLQIVREHPGLLLSALREVASKKSKEVRVNAGPPIFIAVLDALSLFTDDWEKHLQAFQCKLRPGDLSRIYLLDSRGIKTHALLDCLSEPTMFVLLNWLDTGEWVEFRRKHVYDWKRRFVKPVPHQRQNSIHREGFPPARLDTNCSYRPATTDRTRETSSRPTSVTPLGRAYSDDDGVSYRTGSVTSVVTERSEKSHHSERDAWTGRSDAGYDKSSSSRADTRYRRESPDTRESRAIDRRSVGDNRDKYERDYGSSDVRKSEGRRYSDQLESEHRGGRDYYDRQSRDGERVGKRARDVDDECERSTMPQKERHVKALPVAVTLAFSYLARAKATLAAKAEYGSVTKTDAELDHRSVTIPVNYVTDIGVTPVDMGEEKQLHPALKRMKADECAVGVDGGGGTAARDSADTLTALLASAKSVADARFIQSPSHISASTLSSAHANDPPTTNDALHPHVTATTESTATLTLISPATTRAKTEAFAAIIDERCKSLSRMATLYSGTDGEGYLDLMRDVLANIADDVDGFREFLGRRPLLLSA